MKRIRFFFVALLAVLGLWSCSEKDRLEVDPGQLYGKWQQVDSEYYWTFNEDRTGNLVNRGEVAQGDEDNGDFTWVINNGDELEVEFRGSGELGGIDIVKLMTITEVSTSTLKWEDVYGRTTSLVRVE